MGSCLKAPCSISLRGTTAIDPPWRQIDARGVARNNGYWRGGGSCSGRGFIFCTLRLAQTPMSRWSFEFDGLAATVILPPKYIQEGTRVRPCRSGGIWHADRQRGRKR